MEILNQIGKEILGAEMSTAILGACYIFSFLGALFHWVVDTNNGIKKSSKTPDQFSLGYWWENNFIAKLKSLIAALIAIFIVLRLKDMSVFPPMYIYAGAFMTGMSIDWVVKQISSKIKH